VTLLLQPHAHSPPSNPLTSSPPILCILQFDFLFLTTHFPLNSTARGSRNPNDECFTPTYFPRGSFIQGQSFPSPTPFYFTFPRFFRNPAYADLRLVLVRYSDLPPPQEFHFALISIVTWRPESLNFGPEDCPFAPQQRIYPMFPPSSFFPFSLVFSQTCSSFKCFSNIVMSFCPRAYACHG